MDVGHQILAMQDAGDVVERSSVHRESRVPRGFDGLQNIVERGTHFESHDFRTRDCDVLDLALREFQNALNHSRAFFPVTRSGKQCTKFVARQGRLAW